MGKRITRLVVLLAALACGRAQADAGATPLHVNPFQPPPQATADSVAGGRESGSALEVRGVMVAGEHSLANIGGRIIGLGQEIGGYRLILVTEDKVVLAHGNLRRTLALRSDGHGKERHDATR
jgi:hypothetical protein